MKCIKLVIAILFVLVLVGCVDNYEGKVTSVSIDIGGSDIYDDDELNSAIDTIKQAFVNYKGCTLLMLTYNETESIQFTEEYMKNIKGDHISVKEGLVLTIKSDFKTGNLSEEMTLTSNMKYEGYGWNLIRDDDTSEWEIKDRGF